MALGRSGQSRIFVAIQRLIIVLIWFLASIASATGTERPKPELRDRPELRFGILAFRTKPETLKRWQPIADYLAQQIPTHRVVLEAFDYPELEQAVLEHRVDLVLTQPAHYVALSVKQNLYSPLATLVESEQGYALTSFGGVIVAKSQNQTIRGIADLKGKQIAASSRESLGGYQAQAFELLNAGIEPNAFDLVQTVQQDAVIDAVLSGRVDAGFVRSGLIEQMAQEGTISLSDLKVIKPRETPDYPLSLSTALYPQWALAAMPWLTPSVSRQIAGAVLAMPQDGEVAKAARISGFTIPGDYRSVDRLMRALRMPPFDERVPLVVIWEDHRWLIVLTAIGLSLVALWMIGFLIRNRRQRQQANAQLRNSQQQMEHLSRLSILGELAGRLAHELNQPLATIANYARSLMRRQERGNLSAEALEQAAGEIASEAERAAGILNGIRSFARKRAQERSARDMADVVREAIGLMGSMLSQAPEFAIHDRLGEKRGVMIDTPQVQQVLLNLFKNAWDAQQMAGENRPIEVGLNTESDLCYVTVRDHGAGLTPQQEVHLFEPFFTTKPNGLGLGLSICKTIIEAHGGQLHARAAAPGPGMEFCFFLPCNTENPALQSNTK